MKEITIKKSIIRYCLSKNPNHKGNYSISFKTIAYDLDLNEDSARKIVLEMESENLITCWKAKESGKIINFLDILTVTDCGKNLLNT